MSDLLIQKTASISACRLFRYRLTRYWGPGPMLPFVMLNPSTADADFDDPTIRRCMSFARREGKGGIVVVNLYALRSPSPAILSDSPDPFGPDNGDALIDVADYAASNGVPIICAWGTKGDIRPGRVLAILSTLRSAGAELKCLRKTKAGHPWHPLYVRGDKELEAFS